MAASALTSSLVGSLLGKDYRVLEELGRGGMAVVYLVEHQTLHKRFAAKVLSDDHASNQEARARFEQEAHAASHLDHENIVTISDFGITQDQRPFYVMELLRGRTLMDRIESGPMTLEEVVAVSVPVARALAHAHAEGVVHRDVKPENVFLVQRSQGRWGVKVLDFGIAKVTTNPALTKMGQALGSPMFMAPEACRGDDVDQRADLYSFGVLLFLMLTGRVPYSDPTLLKVLQMQVSSPIPSMREINPSISPEIEAVVTRALAKNPEDRYPTMDALLFDLQAVLPEGADALLIQAQFGTSLHDTPFPGQSLRMMALSSQRLMVGDKDASAALASSQRLMVGDKDASAALNTTPAKFPSAPPKRGRGMIVGVLVVLLLAAGGAGAYLWQRQAVATEVAAATPPPTPVPDPTPAPTPPPEQPPVPTNPRRVGPDPSVVLSDPTPIPSDPTPVPTVATPTVPAVVPNKTPPAPRPPVVAVKRPNPPTVTTAKVTTPETPKSGSATKEPPKPAIVETPVVVKDPPPPTPKDPPASGSATPAVIAPKTPPPVAPVVVDTGTMDATPTITSMDVHGPLPSSVVQRGVERILPALRTCYRNAAKTNKKTPLLMVSLSFEIDENSAATSVSAATGTGFGTLHGCVRGAVSRLQTQQAPDVGTVQVVLAITFRPT
jgi:serine/threonine protein kinase